MHVRLLPAVALAALLAGPTAAQAQSKKAAQKPAPAQAAPADPAPTTSGSPKLTLGGNIGYEMDGLDGLQLRFDAVLPFQRLSPQIALSWVGSVGWSYLTHSESAFGVSAKATANILKFVPAARFTLPVNPQLSFYGDAGLGLYWAHESVSYDYGLGITGSGSNSDVGLMFRFGIGGLYQVNPKLQLGLSLYLDPMLGGYDDTTFTIMAGALFGT